MTEKGPGLNEFTKKYFESERNEVAGKIKKVRSENKEAGSVRGVLDEFYKDKQEIKERFESEKEIRDVKEICRKYNCFIVHGIKDSIGKNTSGFNNLVLEKEIDWEEQLKILLLLHPSLPCSAVKPRNGDFIYGNGYGVLLSGGEVFSATTQGSSIAEDINYRSSRHDFSKKIVKDIEGVMQPNIHNNELVIDKPEIAGFFLDKRAVDGNWVGKKLPCSVEKLRGLLHELNLPLYIIDDGVVSEAESAREYQKDGFHYNEYFKPEKELPISEVLSKEYKLPDTAKEEIVTQLKKDSPFAPSVDWEKHL